MRYLLESGAKKRETLINGEKLFMTNFKIVIFSLQVIIKNYDYNI